MSDFSRIDKQPGLDRQSEGGDAEAQQGDPRRAAAMHRRRLQRRTAGEPMVQMKAVAGAQPAGADEKEQHEGAGAEHGGALPVAGQHDASEHEADKMAGNAVGGEGGEKKGEKDEKTGKKNEGDQKQAGKEEKEKDKIAQHAEKALGGDKQEASEANAEKGGPAEQQGEAAAADAAAEQIEEAKSAPREGQVAMKREGAAGGGKSPGAVAAKAISQKGEGAALDPGAQEHFAAAYGKDMSGVRIHNDAKANAAADRAGAEAFTYGKDVFFGSGRYQPEQEHGKFVLAHELAHVAQSGNKQQVKPKRAETGKEGDAQENEASAAADSALAGDEASVGHAQPKIRFFAQNDGSKNRGGHAYMTEHAMAGMGLSEEQGGGGGPSEVRAARMGNWERDLSQAITPGTAGMVKGIMPILNVLAIKDFGRGINAAEFGSYDPVEHIDNPTDLRATDVNTQGGMVSSATDDPAKAGANPDTDKNADQTPGNSHQAYADQEGRYKQENGHKDKGKIINPNDARAFQVDQAGIPRYIYASKEWLTQTLRNSARLGRQKHAEGDERLHGPRLFASGTHTLQDYYAHSNFCEIAINSLIREGGLQVMNEAGKKQTVDKARVLNSQVHANDPKKNGDPEQGNLATGDLKKGGREVLTTGSFNLTDTAASILEEVNENWKVLDPFKQKDKGPNKVVMAALDYIEMNPDNPTDFSGAANGMADVIKALAPQVEAMGSGIATGVEGAAKIGGGIVSGAGKVGGGALKAGGGALGWLGNKVGGKVGGWLGGAGKAVSGAGGSVQQGAQNAGNAVSGAGGEAAESIRRFVGQVNGLDKMIRGKQHTLRELYKWLDTHGPLDLLKAAAKAIPVIGPAVAALVEKVQDEIHRIIEGLLASAWNKVIDVGSQRINKAIADIKANTNIKNKKKAPTGSEKDKKMAEKFGNVSEFYDQKTGMVKQNGETGTANGIAPQSYTPPSHTEVAKDHGDVHGAGDKEHDHDGGGEKEEEGGHVHEGAWLNGLAQKLAMVATEGVGKPVAALWDVVDQGGKIAANDPRLSTIDEAVDKYFQHPADCDFWRPIVQGEVSGKLGPHLLEQLADKKAGTPDVPSFVEIPKDHPINKPDGGPQQKEKKQGPEQAPPPPAH
jgi:Domain of unknown function (DUF4157)/Heterokaryon incompatibility protein Het-C